MSKYPSRHTLRQFAAYNVGGIAYFVVGYGLFVLLYGVYGMPWWAAKAVGDICGWTVNYVLQRYVTFRRESRNHRERALLARFTTISVLNIPLDYAIVGGLKLLGVSPFIGLWLSSLFFTLWKYIWYKHWVFRSR